MVSIQDKEFVVFDVTKVAMNYYANLIFNEKGMNKHLCTCAFKDHVSISFVT